MNEFSPDSQLERYAEIQWRTVLQDLAALSAIESPSTQEHLVATYIEQRLLDLNVRTERDAAGNVWVRSEEPEGKILLVAHMDKVGAGRTLESTDDSVTGRLDDALGVALAMNVFQSGRRPSVVFTVEEESEHEVISPEGDKKMAWRLKPGDTFNAGARQAVDDIFELEERPRVVINLDVTSKTKPGTGAAIYMSSTPPGQAGFPYPTGPIKDAAHILKEQGLHANYIEGGPNDSIEFTFLPNVGVLSVEVPIADPHTDHEHARRTDIEEAQRIISAFVEHHDQFASDLGRRMSRSNSQIPLEGGDA